MTVYAVEKNNSVRDVVTERETAIQTARYLAVEGVLDWEQMDTEAVACWAHGRDRILVTEHDETTVEVWDGEKRQA